MVTSQVPACRARSACSLPGVASSIIRSQYSASFAAGLSVVEQPPARSARTESRERRDAFMVGAGARDGGRVATPPESLASKPLAAKPGAGPLPLDRSAPPPARGVRLEDRRHVEEPHAVVARGLALGE